MSIESELFTALSSLVSGRVYPDEAPSGAVAPYIVYQQVGGVAPTFLESAVPSIRNARMQVAVWAATRASSSALSLSVHDALISCATFQARPIGGMIANRDPNTLLYGSRQDFGIWDQR